MEKLESIRMVFLRSIMSMKSCVSTRRFRLALNLPKMEFSLFVRFRKVLEKYREHLGEETRFHRTIVGYFENLIEESTVGKMENLEEWEWKDAAKRCCLKR